MGDHSAIEWTDATWNPVVGCTKVSKGCQNCYAKQIHDQRHDAFKRGLPVAPQYARPFEHVQLMPQRLELPLRWRKPRRIFVNSVSDLFHENVPTAFVARVWAVMALAPRHTFQILTKRPARMRAILTRPDFYELVLAEANAIRAKRPALGAMGVSDPALHDGAFYQHVWLGTSVENQQAADERIPELLATPAAVRFLSCEPLLGPIDFFRCGSRGADEGDPFAFSALRGTDAVEPPIPGIDWVIVGGESGPKARPFDIRWAAELVAQCGFAGVPCFVKQFGAVPMEPEADWRGRATARLLNARNRDRVPEGFVPLFYSKKGGNIAEWPEELRVREMPEVCA